MSYISVNENEREAAQALEDLKNYSMTSSIWEQKPGYCFNRYPSVTTFSPLQQHIQNGDIFTFPDIHAQVSPPSESSASPTHTHYLSENESVHPIEEKRTKSKSRKGRKQSPKTKSQRRKSKRKPRWNKALKDTLSQAVIDQKKLSEMDTFDWHAIARKTGKSGKACKWQWENEIFPKIKNSFKH